MKLFVSLDCILAFNQQRRTQRQGTCDTTDVEGGKVGELSHVSRRLNHQLQPFAIDASVALAIVPAIVVVLIRRQVTMLAMRLLVCYTATLKLMFHCD